ncbi:MULTISPECIES: hypothetical protein [Nonlabens]|uniref:Immunity protein 43 domain-containing protein n=2 Tax=Nonlabens ulvanivorans TaxID=906888 RepID=A0A090W9W9_NONUL|nr:hypothetical protein [Nonlabens ulvanivorans]GAL73810.1 hypothetical protein JCM19275_2657 [Nonlabens ulvanivorans]
MGNYFIIYENCRRKNFGRYPQIKDYIYKSKINSGKFIDLWIGKEVPNNIILEKAELLLNDNSNLTHGLVPLGAIGFTGALVINNELKFLFKEHYIYGINFLPLNVYHKGVLLDNYNISHISKFDDDLIDFEKTQFSKTHGSYPNRVTEIIDINSKAEFYNEKAKYSNPADNTYILIDKFRINENFNDIDLFALQHVFGGIKFIISEKLKSAMDELGVVCYNYRPINIGYNEWESDPKVRFERYGTK